MKIVQMTEQQYATVCGLVQPSDSSGAGGINHQGIFSEAFPDLCRLFPLSAFEAAVQRGIIEYDEDAGT